MDTLLLRHHRRRRYNKRSSGGPQALRFAIVGLAAILLSQLALVLLGVGAVLGVYAYYVQDLPSAEEIGRASVETFETTRIYDRTGQHVLYEIIPSVGGRRTEVPLSRIPAHLRNGTIAMEDKTFYTNPVGINIEGVARAVWGVISNQYAGGGSSIPQQLIRNVVMTPEERIERSYERKIKEMILAYELTRRYPGVEGRDQILEWYLNNIFYGHFAYGVEAAAQTYFNKHVEDLTLAESAMIVPLGNMPAYNPIDNPEEAKKRQEIVLDQMYLQGYITAEQALAAKQQALVIAPPSFDIVAPHYVLYVRDLLEKRYGSDAVYGGGLQVTTAIDLDIQNKAQELVQQHIAAISEKHNVHNAAAVVLDAKTAEIKAIVGSLDYFDRTIDGQINMAISPRQPGSSFKPFTYATAFAHGYTPATMVMDVRTSFPDPPNAPYVPENYSRKFKGPMLLRRALACSYNVPAVAMMNKVGSMKVVETAHLMGINTLNDAYYGLSLTLGGGEVTLLDMTYAFSVFANGGMMVGEPIPGDQVKEGYRSLDPVAILKVTDAKGKVLYEYQGPQRRETIRPEVAFLITDILSDNAARSAAFGADSVLKIKERPAAVKTGTTNDFHDGWTVGYTPQYVVGVWTGNTNYEAMKNAADGVRTAGPIWHDIITWLHEGLPVEGFTRPANIETVIVDSTSGKLPTDYSPARMQEIFIKGTAPTEYDDIHQPFQICKASGKLATAYCPPEDIEQKVFDIYPAEANDWVREQNIPQPPTEYCDIHGAGAIATDVAIISPKSYQAVRGIIPIMGNAKPGGLQKYWVQVGQGMTPNDWVTIGSEHSNSVDNNVLENWDTQGLDGLYTLQLSAAAGSGVSTTSVQVIVDNISPTLSIMAPSPDQEFEFPKDEWINIQVDAQDNVSMGKVEFYLDEQLLGFSTVAPYTLRWTPAVTDTTIYGPHKIHVIAYDSAGNQVQSETIEVKVRPEGKKTQAEVDPRVGMIPTWKQPEG